MRSLFLNFQAETFKIYENYSCELMAPGVMELLLCAENRHIGCAHWVPLYLHPCVLSVSVLAKLLYRQLSAREVSCRSGNKLMFR